MSPACVERRERGAPQRVWWDGEFGSFVEISASGHFTKSVVDAFGEVCGSTWMVHRGGDLGNAFAGATPVAAGGIDLE